MVRDSGIPYTVSSGVADGPSTVLFSGARLSLINTNWSNMAGLSEVQVPILQFGQWRQSISALCTILTGVSGGVCELLLNHRHLLYKFLAVTMTDKGLQTQQMVGAKP